MFQIQMHNIMHIFISFFVVIISSCFSVIFQVIVTSSSQRLYYMSFNFVLEQCNEIKIILAKSKYTIIISTKQKGVNKVEKREKKKRF